RPALRRPGRLPHGYRDAGSLDAGRHGRGTAGRGARGAVARDERAARGLRDDAAAAAGGAAPGGAAAHAAHDPLLRMAGAALGRSGVQARLPVVRHATVLAGPGALPARADGPVAG